MNPFETAREQASDVAQESGSDVAVVEAVTDSTTRDSESSEAGDSSQRVSTNVAAVTLVDGDRPFRATVPDSLTVSEGDTVVVGYTTSGSAYVENALTQADSGGGDTGVALPMNISISPSSDRSTILKEKRTVYWDGARQEAVAGDTAYGNNRLSGDTRGTGWISQASGSSYLTIDCSDLVEQYENPVLFNEYQTDFRFQTYEVRDDETDELLVYVNSQVTRPLAVWPLANTSGRLRIGPPDAQTGQLFLSGSLQFDDIDIDTAWQRPAPGDNSGLVDTFGAGDSFESTYGRNFSNQKWQPQSGLTGDIAEKYRIYGASGDIAVSSDAVFASGSTYLFAFERADKQTRWAVDVDTRVDKGPQFYQGTVYAAESLDTYYSIDAQSGNATQVSMNPVNYYTGPDDLNFRELFIYGGDFIGIYDDADGGGVAIRFDTGSNIVWSREFSVPGNAVATAAIDYTTDNILILGGTLDKHSTTIMQLSDGVIVSSTTVSRGAQEKYSPACVGGNAYFGAEATTSSTPDPGIEKVDMSDGSRTHAEKQLGASDRVSIGSDGTDLIVFSNNDDKILSVPLSDLSVTNWSDDFIVSGALEKFVIMDEYVYTGVDGTELRRYKKSDGTLEQTGQGCEAVYAGFENQLFIRDNDSNEDVVNLVEKK